MRRLTLAVVLLAACDYPTEPVRIIQVVCVAGDTVHLPAGDSVDVVLPCIDPRDLPTDSLPIDSVGG